MKACRRFAGGALYCLLLKRVEVTGANCLVEAAGFEDGGREIELVNQLLAPLLAKVGRHDHQHTALPLGPLLRE